MIDLTQTLDLTSMREEIASSKLKRDTQCAFRVNQEMFWEMRRVAAEKKFHNVAEMMRFITQNYLNENK